MSKSNDQNVSIYRGHGKLNDQDCRFEVDQRPDGQIRVYCQFSESPDIVNAHGVELCGSTNEDGMKVCGKGPLQRRPWDVDYNTEPVTYFSHYGMWKLTIGEPDWSKAGSVTFALTNFLFCGDDADSGGRGTCYNALKLELDGSNITFQKMDNYYDIDNAVLKGESTEVTCEFTIEVDGRGRDEMRKMANRICDLLTIAQGRRIEWINYRVYDANSSILFTSYEARRTDSRNGFGLIDFRQPKRAINYLERGYPACRQFDTDYPTMLNGVANIIFDSNAIRFSLPHALIMFSMVDALSNKVCKSKYLESRIKRLNSLYRLRITKNERKLFVKSRNCVVHELKFHTGDTKNEYTKCYRIFYRLLLRILNYQSVYFDITLPKPYGLYGENRLHPLP